MRRKHQVRAREEEARTGLKTHAMGPRSFSLFRVLLPSVATTLECGFRYAVVIGYDLGDQYYDDNTAHEEISAWFEQHVAAPARERHIHIEVSLVACNNTIRKPGPVFTTITRGAGTNCRELPDGGGCGVFELLIQPGLKHESPKHSPPICPEEAYNLNADFIYRVNDDSEFMTKWATPLTEAVVAHGPPYGVVGPLVCSQGGNVRILTHDFTHRTHM